jgi:hypothetical protein
MSKTQTSTRKTVKRRAASGAEQAILEEVVLTFPADDALSETPKSELEGVPYLGETRRLALALAGLVTQDDLRRATAAQIGGVKGVGLGNATRIKAWLDQSAAAIPDIDPVPDIDPILAAANQNVQDVFQKLGDAAARLKDHLLVKARDKALDRQLDKLDSVASELAEGPDTLSAKQVQNAVKTLDKIAALLQNAADEPKNLSPKKQAALIEELRTRRKRLQKTLDD